MTSSEKTMARNALIAPTEQVIHALNDLCATLEPGDRIPTHLELMRRFQASERAVLRALEELQRSGKIVRKQGVGTFVAPPTSTESAPAPLLNNRTIVAITYSDNSFFDRCLDLLCHHTEAAELSLLCKPISGNGSPVDLELLAANALANTPAGFVIFRYDLAPLAEKLQGGGASVVIVGTPPADITPNVPCVYGDHEHGGYLITGHLIDLGHRRIGFIHNEENLTERRRWRGHQRALHEARRAGLSINDTVLPEEMESWAADPSLAAAYLRRPDSPTALIAWNDHEAAKLLTILARAGVQVPQEVSVAGYDDMPEARLVYPPLTTVDHSIGQQLRAAVDMLTRPRSAQPSDIVVTPILVRRESTAPPPSV